MAQSKLRKEQVDLSTYAPLASPTFTGTVTLPTGLTGVVRVDSGVVSVDTDVTDIVAAASTSAAGKVELATDAEMTTGTDTTRAITPANAKVELDKKLALAGGTMTGNIQLGETEIKLDAVLSGDETWSGITMSGTLGATIAIGDLCYLNADDSRWELADANLSDGYDKLLGICLDGGADGDTTTMLTYGKVRSAAFPAFTVGSVLYMSETAGDVTHTQPTTADVAIRIVGAAITAEDMLFNPSNDYIVHT